MKLNGTENRSSFDDMMTTGDGTMQGKFSNFLLFKICITCQEMHQWSWEVANREGEEVMISDLSHLSRTNLMTHTGITLLIFETYFVLIELWLHHLFSSVASDICCICIYENSNLTLHLSVSTDRYVLLQ